MEKDLVLVDTNVFIDSFRGKEVAKNDLHKLKGKIAVSIITVLELFRGAKTSIRKRELEKQLKAYSIVHLDPYVSTMALKIMKQYISPQQDVFIADCLIAATAIVNNMPLLTYNRTDFRFIKGVKIYKKTKMES